MADDAYLLDTTVASIAFDSGNSRYNEVSRRLADLGNSTIWICSISSGEIEYGLSLYSNVLDRTEAIRQNVKAYEVLPIDEDTGTYYGGIRGELFRKHAPRDSRNRIKKGSRPEDLVDRTESKQLGIQENDLWIVAVAVANNFALITGDRMQRILEAAEAIYSYKRAVIWKSA